MQNKRKWPIMWSVNNQLEHVYVWSLALTLTVLISSAKYCRAVGSSPLCGGGCNSDVVPAPFLQPLYHSLTLLGRDRKPLYLLALTSSSCPRNSLVSQLITCQLAILALHWRWPPTNSQRGGAGTLAGHTLGCSRGLCLDKAEQGQLAKSLGRDPRKQGWKSKRRDKVKQKGRK